MSCCVIQQNGVASHGEMRTTEAKDSVVCPKPRRVGHHYTTINDPSRSLHRHLGHQAEISDSRAGSELLDIILSKGGNGAERSSTQRVVSALSPPFFCGSPPSRVPNPLIQDARFMEGKQLIPSFSPAPPGSSSSPNSSARKGGCIRASFRNNPAVRIEGFDCLDRDRRNCSIPALA